MKKRKKLQQNSRKTDEPLDLDELNIFGTAGYTGDVKLEIYSNDKLYNVIEGHNFGTKELCRYICTCLIGKPNVSKMPGALQPCKRYSNKLEDIFAKGTPYIQDETSDIKIEGGDYLNEEGDEEWCYGKFTLKFNIQGQLLAGVNQLAGLRLYSLDSSTLYAEIDFGVGNELDISKIKNSTLVVKWTLRVSTIKGKGVK